MRIFYFFIIFFSNNLLFIYEYKYYFPYYLTKKEKSMSLTPMNFNKEGYKFYHPMDINYSAAQMP